MLCWRAKTRYPRGRDQWFTFLPCRKKQALGLPHSSGRLRSTSFLRYIRLQRRRMLGVCVLFYSAGILYTDTVDPYRLWIASYIAAVPSDRTRSTHIYNRSFFPPCVSILLFLLLFLFVTVVGCFPAVLLYCRCNIWQILSDVIFPSSWYSHHII
jgi:hypothetical protein